MKNYFKKKKERKKKKQMERELRRKKQFQYNQDKKSNSKTLKGTKNPFNNFHSNRKVNNETFGCEVCNDLLSTNQKKILEKIGLGNIIKVKRRNEGLTSSGISGKCHSNVRKLVELIGGKQLVGYVVQTNVGYRGERCVQFYNHSVWITPEGKVADPTMSVNRHKYNMTYFIPIFVYQEDNVWTFSMDLMFPENFENVGYILQGDLSHPEDKRYPFRMLCREVTMGTVKLTNEDFNRALHGVVRGKFAKPSLSTGKTYDELMESKKLSLVA
jgi:hypothetical protein